MSTPTNFRTNRELYDSAMASLEKKEDVYRRNKGKNYENDQKRLKAAEVFRERVDELEPIKDKLSIPPGCKNFLIKKYITEKYNRIADIDDFSMLKGVTMENNSIDLFNQKHGTNYAKNKKKIDNDYLTGIPDLIKGDSVYDAEEVIDIKTPFDIFSYMQSVDNPLKNADYWQIQGYMALTNAPIGTVAFCLTNTPAWMMDDELRKLKLKYGGHPEYEKLIRLGRMRIRRNLIYDDIPTQERVVAISVDRDEDAIDKIYCKIDACREFLKEFEETHMQFTKRHRKTILVDDED
jgi:hypothetical protein